MISKFQSSFTGEQLENILKKIDPSVATIIEYLEFLYADRIQTLVKKQGNETIIGSNESIIVIPCGFDAYEIKTIEVENLTNENPIQVEILENNVNNKSLFKSLLNSYIYTNTGGVCNIDKNKNIYLKVINGTQTPVDIKYEIKLVNLLVRIEEENN